MDQNMKVIIEREKNTVKELIIGVMGVNIQETGMIISKIKIIIKNKFVK